MTVSNWKRLLFCLILSIADTGHPGNAHTRMRHPIISLSLFIHLLVSLVTPLSGSNFVILIAFYAYRRRMGTR